MMAWFLAFDVEIQAAFIGVAAALLTILLKDFGLYFWREAREHKRSALAVYRNYADPLASASAGLFWRLRETLTAEGRGEYLKESGAESDFDKYKYQSTIYRLASMIGWLRAYRRELTFFSLGDPKELAALKRAINRFEAALADGSHVETQRVRSVAQLWNIQIPADEACLSRLAVQVEKIIKGALRTNQADMVFDLAEQEQIALCQAISDQIATEAKIDRISAKIISETLQRAIRSLSIREAWLYRDFQSGLGDLMIKEVSDGVRRFDVIGFREFEALLTSANDEEKRWVARLNRVFDRLDISGADSFDARVQLLEETFLATMDLLCELQKVDRKREVVSLVTITEMEKLRKDVSWRKGQH